MPVFFFDTKDELRKFLDQIEPYYELRRLYQRLKEYQYITSDNYFGTGIIFSEKTFTDVIFKKDSTYRFETVETGNDVCFEWRVTGGFEYNESTYCYAWFPLYSNYGEPVYYDNYDARIVPMDK